MKDEIRCMLTLPSVFRRSNIFSDLRETAAGKIRFEGVLTRVKHGIIVPTIRPILPLPSPTIILSLGLSLSLSRSLRKRMPLQLIPHVAHFARVCGVILLQFLCIHGSVRATTTIRSAGFLPRRFIKQI